MCLFVAVKPPVDPPNLFVNIPLIIAISLGIPMILLAVLLVVRSQRYRMIIWMTDVWHADLNVLIHTCTQTFQPFFHSCFYFLLTVVPLHLKVDSDVSRILLELKIERRKEKWEEWGVGECFLWKPSRSIHAKLPWGANRHSPLCSEIAIQVKCKLKEREKGNVKEKKGKIQFFWSSICFLKLF